MDYAKYLASLASLAPLKDVLEPTPHPHPRPTSPRYFRATNVSNDASGGHAKRTGV
ncbi:MAG: hypothetical protein QOC85_205 [Streptomyces sp.]|nr:hypothetical protein [Streptomyces sp.]